MRVSSRGFVIGLSLLTLLSVSVESSLSFAMSCEATQIAFAPRATGLGRRGFLGAKQGFGAAATSAAGAKAIMPWNVKIFVVGSADEAMANDWVSARIADLQTEDPEGPVAQEWKKINGNDLVKVATVHAQGLIAAKREVVWNPLMTGLYVIAPGVNLAAMSEDEVAAFAKTIPHLPVYEVSDDGQSISQLDASLVADRFDPQYMTRTQYFPNEPMHIRMNGYFFPKQRGIFRIEDMDSASSKTYKRLEERLAADVSMRGMVFTKNKDLEGVMRGVMKQQRKGQSPQNNRITEDTIKTWKEMEARGETISLESWMPIADGQYVLIGGTFGLEHDGQVELNSIFYPPNKPDYARHLFVWARDVLKQARVRFIDAGMVTPWSRQMKAVYVDAFTEFLPLFASSDKNAVIDFEPRWSRSAVEWHMPIVNPPNNAPKVKLTKEDYARLGIVKGGKPKN